MKYNSLMIVALVLSVSFPAYAYVPDDLDFDEFMEEPAASNAGQTESTGKRITVKSIDYEMVYIPPGTFMMGSPSSEPGRYDDERQHRVTLTKGFYIGVTEVTQAQWRKVMGSNPSYFSNCDDCPVEQVSWNDAQEFIKKLNRMEGTDKYRLPTEAQWEYACRSGSSSAYSFGGGSGVLGQYAWYCDNSGNKTHPVALKKPNAWGLYDMHGNVREWCSDWKGDYPYGSVTDPEGPSTGSGRVERGGSWGSRARGCRSASRDYGTPSHRDGSLGLRLSRTD